MIIRKEGFETKLQAFESPDSDKRAKSYTKTKIRLEIAIRNNRGKSEKKKLGMKKYDQSVTCLADDPQNLAIRSNKRHTPGTLSQTNKHTISTQLEARVKLK